MTLSDVASIAAIFSSIAVAVSLVYVALQVRQAEKNQRAVIQQGRANRVSDAALALSEPGTAAIMGKGAREPEAFTAEELERFLTICRAAFISAEDSFLQHRAGLLDEVSFKSFAVGAKGQFAASAGLRAAWRMLSSQFDPAFADFMDRQLAEAPRQQAQDRLTTWALHLKADHAEPLAAPSP
jgi:hypothetical protein